MNETAQRFFEQFHHWGLHCAICAAPSFAIAGLYLGFFGSPVNTAAMLFGVTAFILAFSAISTFWKPLHDPNHLLSRALRLALKIRFAVSAISLLLILSTMSDGGRDPREIITFVPDYWAGMLALTILNYSGGFFGFTEVIPTSGNFLTTLIWTLLEGGILSFALFMLSFFCLLFVSARQKRAWQEESLPELQTGSNLASKRVTSSE
ncbi:MAG: hypothetical protein ACSHYB_09055 [Roseibacillus sp.]